MGEKLQRIQSLLLQAVEIEEPQARAEFLTRACGSDVELRKEVEALIAADSSAGFFMPDKPNAQARHRVQSAVQAARAEGELAPLPGAERIGQQIGPYRLVQSIGQGGCGVVYVAEQEAPIRRAVALKIIKLGMDTRSVVARFEAERQALALMDHPNIARVLDAGATETGRPFFVMELVRGIKITEYCDKHQLPVRQRLGLFIQVCQAVQHAHQKGIVHRDLKPSNILVTEADGQPTPKVIDFGIARAVGDLRLTDKTLVTAPEQFLGTPPYMSPEQAATGDRDVDTRSDIYSLGALLYELLTGKTPLDVPTPSPSAWEETRRVLRDQTPVRPSTRFSSLPSDEQAVFAARRQLEPNGLVQPIRGDLDCIVMKCLEKERPRRYDTASGLAEDIQRHLNNEPIMARPPSRLYEFQKTVRRHKAGFLAATALVLVLAAGVVVSSWEARRAWQAEGVQSRLRADAQAARGAAQAQELVARQRAYASDIKLLQDSVGLRLFGKSRELLNRQRPAPGQQDLRGWEWRYLWQFCRSEALCELCRRGGGITSLAASFDGNWLAIGDREGVLSVWDIRKRVEAVPLPTGLLGGGVGDALCVFSPVAPVLAYPVATNLGPNQWRQSIRFWDARTPQQVPRELPLSSWCRRLAFSSDGQTLYTITEDEYLTIWPLAEGAQPQIFRVNPIQHGLDPPFPLTVNSSMHLAAFSGPDGLVRVVNLVTGQEQWTRKVADEFIGWLTFSPDGKLLVSGGRLEGAWLWAWDALSGKPIGHSDTNQAMGDFTAALVFWPDGKRLAATSNDSVRLWDLSDPEHIKPLGRRLRGSQTQTWALALLPDEKTLVSGCVDGSVWLWDTTAIPEDPATITLPAALVAWRFASDSRSIVSLDREGKVTRWQGAHFHQAVHLFTASTNVVEATFSADAKILAAVPTNGLVQLWDAAAGRLLTNVITITAHSEYNSPGLLFIEQGRKLLTLDSDSQFHVWDVATAGELSKWQAPYNAMGIAVTRDERTLLAVGRLGHVGPASLRNLATGSEKLQTLSITEVEDCAIAPDGKLFAGASSLGGAKLWRTDTFEEQVIPAFSEGTFSVCFSPDGRRLATGGGGKSAVKLWYVPTLQELLSLGGDSTFFYPTAFSPDGNTIASMNYMGLLHLWQAPSWEEITRAEEAHEPISRR